MERKLIIDEIVAREWELFQQVENIGGRASCQDMPHTFELMRAAQYSVWTDEMLASWKADLDAYAAAGENPVTLKYAYMMESTHPDEFATLRGQLPEVSARARELAEQIIAIQLRWAEEQAERYPSVAGRGRALRTADDTPERTSQETYARGELLTYSERTLELMRERFAQAADAGRNLQEEIVLAEARAYGYDSLTDLERSIVHG